jgi:hypothetical protein
LIRIRVIYYTKIDDKGGCAASEDDADQREHGSKARDIKQLSDKLGQNHHLLSSIPADTAVSLLKYFDCHIREGKDVEMPKCEEVCMSRIFLR